MHLQMEEVHGNFTATVQSTPTAGSNNESRNGGTRGGSSGGIQSCLEDETKVANRASRGSKGRNPSSSSFIRSNAVDEGDQVTLNKGTAVFHQAFILY